LIDFIIPSRSVEMAWQKLGFLKQTIIFIFPNFRQGKAGA